MIDDPDAVFTTGIRNVLETLISAATKIVRGYAPNASLSPDDYARTTKDLRHVERLLVIVVSSAGATERESAIPAVWALNLARTCFQAFLLRRTYDIGRGLGHGIDPSMNVQSLAMALPQTLPEDDMEAVRTTIDELRSHLVDILNLCELDEGAGADPVVNNKSLVRTLEAFAKICERTLRNVARSFNRNTAAAVDSSARSDSGELLDALVAARARTQGVEHARLDALLNANNFGRQSRELGRDCLPIVREVADFLGTTSGALVPSSWAHRLPGTVMSESDADSYKLLMAQGFSAAKALAARRSNKQ